METTSQFSEPDYTGVPMFQLREQIKKHWKSDWPDGWLAEKAGIDQRELYRITDLASPRAVLGLNKADRLLMALRQSVNTLSELGELDIVPLGNSLSTARLMARDILYSEGPLEADESLVTALARTLLAQKQIILSEATVAEQSAKPKVARARKQTARDQGVPETYLSTKGTFRPGLDARYKSDLVAAVLCSSGGERLHMFAPEDARVRLAQRGWLHFLQRKQAVPAA